MNLFSIILTVSKIDGLSSELSNRYTKVQVDQLLASTAVTIQNVSGLQTALDTKASATQLNQKQNFEENFGIKK